MRVTVLGSGTLLPDRDRGSASHLVEVSGATVLLDCGAGCLRALAAHAPSWSDLTHIAVTHFHVDHVGALAPLLWALRYAAEERIHPLYLLGPEGFRAHMEALSHAHGDFVLDPGFPIEVVEFGPVSAPWSDPDGRFRLAHCPTPHTDRSLAYRLEAEGGVVGYTGDTELDADVSELMRGVSVLIVECSRADGRAVPGHLSPASLAVLLEVARPAMALVTHVYSELEPEEIPDLVAATGYTGQVVAASDGTSVSVLNGSPELAARSPTDLDTARSDNLQC